MSEQVPGQLDLLALVMPDRNERERRIYAGSGLVFETDWCKEGDHPTCTGLLDVRTGESVGRYVAPPSRTTRPCRCECHA